MLRISIINPEICVPFVLKEELNPKALWVLLGSETWCRATTFTSPRQKAVARSLGFRV